MRCPHIDGVDGSNWCRRLGMLAFSRRRRPICRIPRCAHFLFLPVLLFLSRRKSFVVFQRARYAMALYYGHLPTSPAQKVFVAGAAAIRALADPRRADMVAKLSEVTGRVALEKLRARLTASAHRICLFFDSPTLMILSQPKVDDESYRTAPLFQQPTWIQHVFASNVRHTALATPTENSCANIVWMQTNAHP